MFTIKILSKKNKKNSVVVRVTNNRRSAEVSLSLQLNEADLENALSNTPRHDLLSLSRWLHSVMAKVSNLKFELMEQHEVDLPASEIAQRIRVAIFGDSSVNSDKHCSKKDTGEFVEWFERFAATHTKGAKTYRCYKHTLSRLVDYCPELNSLSFKDVNVAWLDGFDKFLSKTVGVNGRNHHMRNIRAVFKYAIRNDLDIRNPFERMRLKTEPTVKRSLTVAQFRELLDCELLPYATIYRDMFLLSFLLIGINSVDLFALERLSPDGRVEYRRAKTGKLYSVKVEPEAMEIIERYRGKTSLLNLRERWKTAEGFSAACNNALKSIGAPATAPGRSKKGKSLFPALTMYWARHTWATIAADLDVPDAVISAALGHGGENRVTDIYIRRNMRKVDDANRRVIDWVLYGTSQN